MNTKHTPAPWKTIINPISLDLEVWNDKDCICVVDEDYKANAKLIAAAPELLEALQEIESLCGKDSMPYYYNIHNRR